MRNRVQYVRVDRRHREVVAESIETHGNILCNRKLNIETRKTNDSTSSHLQTGHREQILQFRPIAGSSSFSHCHEAVKCSGLQTMSVF